ncbi:MAG: hypothetical protein NC337_08395 [Roseburia sp.]|nr:hypothetical protein [Roseburia sp.]
MLISLRDSNGKLAVKDVLDIDFDMSVTQNDDRDGYYVMVNRRYRLNEKFASEETAEQEMLRIAGMRNSLENDLRSY